MQGENQNYSNHNKSLNKSYEKIVIQRQFLNQFTSNSTGKEMLNTSAFGASSDFNPSLTMPNYNRDIDNSTTEYPCIPRLRARIPSIKFNSDKNMGERQEVSKTDR